MTAAVEAVKLFAERCMLRKPLAARPETIDTIDPYKHFSVLPLSLCAPPPPAIRQRNRIRGLEALSSVMP